MNSAASALVSAAAIASILGVYSAAVGSEVRIAGEAADMIASMAAASNEALSAAYDAESRSVVVRNHGHAPARLYMADIVAGAGQGGAGGGVKVRVALAPEGYAAPPGMAVVNGTVEGAATAASREIAPGAAASIPLAGALAAASAAAAAAKGAAAGAGARIVHPGSAAVTTDAGTRIAVGGLPAATAAAGSVGGAGNGSGGPGGGGDGTATINGMGINSRIVHEWHGGFAVSGSGTVGAVSVPAGPYVEAGGGADGFAGVVLGGDPSSAAAVPSLSGSYSYSRGPGGSLALGGGAGAGAPAPLAYASKRDLEGSPSVARDGQGLHLRGPGRVLLEMAAYERGSALFLSGSASGGAELFVGASPYDLASQAYAAGRGFEVWRGQAAGPSHSRFDSPCPPSGRAEFSAAYWWDVPSVPAGLRGRVSHGAAAAANNNLPDPATGQRGEPLMPAAARIEYGPGGGGGLYAEIAGLSMQSGSSPQLNGPAGCRMRPADVLPSIYDEAPIAESLAVLPGGPAYGRFEAVLPAPGAGEGAAYVLAHLDGPAAAASLSARQASPGEALLSLRGLPPSVPYRIASGGATLAAGVTSGAGGVDVAAADMGPGAGVGAARAPGAVLHVYADSFAVRGRPAGAVAYDPLHGESFSIPSWRPGTVYVVHAWARMPVVGQANVSGAALNGTLPLPFVDGARGSNGTGPGAAAALSPEYVHVPIVPRYAHAAMAVNGVPAVLAFADAAGGGGGGGGASVRVLPPSSSSHRESGQGPVLRASAQAGASSAHVAPRDGALGAVFAVQASGSVRIDNTYALRGAGGDAGWRFNASEAATGPPPGWPPAGAPAPVSAHVAVRVNGEPAGTVQLAAAGTDYGGGPGYSSSAGAGSVLESVAHHAPGHGARGSASVPVRAGDLVEFSVVVNASAAAPPYHPPAGAEVSRAGGSAYAEASILSGTIVAGM